MGEKTLKILRIKAGLSQGELARLSGSTQASITRYEADASNLRKASYNTLVALANAVGVSVWDIDLGMEGLFISHDDLLEEQKYRLNKFEEYSAQLKETTTLDLVKQIEQDFKRTGTVLEGISVYDYLLYYFIK